MKQWKIIILFLVFLSAVLQVVPSTAQNNQSKCPPKKKAWKSKQTKKWFSFKEAKQPKEKQEKMVQAKPVKQKAVAQKQKAKKTKYIKDKRYVKRLKAIKKETKTIATSTKCPH